MNWNVRVVRTRVPGTPIDVVEWSYDLREVYYTKRGKPKLWTERAVGPHGDSMEEVRTYHGWCQIALTKPVLTETTIDGHDVLVEEHDVNPDQP